MKTITDKGLPAIVPSDGNDWIYQDIDNETRSFWRLVYIGKNSDISVFAECTTAEKEQWEQEHPQSQEEQL